MNILTKIRAINELNDKELQHHTTNTPQSWHHQYRNSAWIHIGGLSYNLSEGDLICVFSQFGEVVQIHMPRDRESGRSKGFCFLCYLDTRSAILAVDNLNGSKVASRVMKVDHVLDFKPPKDSDEEEEEKEKKDLHLGMAELNRRKKIRAEKRKKRMEHPDFDHTRREIRKSGVAPQMIAPEQGDSDDDLIPYEGEKLDLKKIKKEAKRKRKEEKRIKKEESEREDKYQRDQKRDQIPSSSRDKYRRRDDRERRDDRHYDRR